MSVNPLRLIAAQQLTAAPAIYYTSTGIKTRVDKCSFTNTDSVAHSVTIYLVAIGDTPTAGNMITSSHAIAAGETWNCPDIVGQILPPNNTIQMSADANAVVTVSAAGTQIS